MSTIKDFSSTDRTQNVTRYIFLAATILSLLFATAFATIGIIVLERLNDQFTETERIAVFFHIFLCMFFALVCLFGSYASISKHLSATSLFTSLIIGQILLSIGSGVLCIYLLFSQPWDVNKCLTVAFDQFTKNLCQRTDVLKGVTTAMFAVLWLVEIALIFVGNAFLAHLRLESMEFERLGPKYDRDGRYC